MPDQTDIQKWTIKPTPLERAMGRLVRGPDGDHGDAGGDKASGGDDAAASGGGDGSDATGSGDAGDGAGASDDATVLGAADTDTGAGDKSSNEDGDDKDSKDDKSADGADGPPEKYELSLTVKDAEGKDQKVDIDPVLLTEATPILKELGLSNEQANKVAGLVPKVQERLIQQQNDDFSAVKAGWAKEAQADEEIGGKKWKETQAFAARALDHFGAPKGSPFRALLDETGLGNHPEMIRMFRKIGEAAGEDGTFARGDAKIDKKPREEVLYPEDAPKK